MYRDGASDALLETPVDVVRSELRLASKSRNHPDLLTLESIKTCDDIADFISTRGWWTPHLVELFSKTTVARISLSLSIDPPEGPFLYTKAFFKQGDFACLASLSFARVPLSHSDLLSLRLLPRLTTLNLAATGVSSQHLLHLITHAEMLQDLNISSNSLVTDESRVLLSALPQLQVLHLRDTSITMSCLRHLVYSLPSTCRLITVPQACLDYLNHRSQHYCQQIPAGYIQDPRHVSDLTIPLLKRNLDLHKKFNRDLVVGSGKAAMVEKLMGILCGRVADGCIAKRIGRETSQA